MDLQLTYLNYTDEDILKKVIQVVDEFKASKKITITSSGTTGTPKKFTFNENQVLYSINNTLNFFELRKGQTALLCLSTDYIAGKMMVLRALLGQLKLIITEPALNPFKNIPDDVNIDFAPLIPAQIKHLITHYPNELKRVKKILIGGGKLDAKSEHQLIEMQVNAYESFGMTETLSHIAIRKIGEKYFKCLNGIHIKADGEGLLTVSAPELTGTKEIKTNDVVAIRPNAQFIWKGRKDFMINSGGHKIFPEQLEEQLSDNELKLDFFIVSKNDDKWGEIPVILVEGEPDQQFIELLNKKIEQLKPYDRPKEIWSTEKFQRTGSKKIKRKQSLEKAIKIRDL